MMRLLPIALLLTFGSTACRRPAARVVDTARSEAATPAPTSSAPASDQAEVRVPRSVAELDALLGRLRSYHGQLRETDSRYDTDDGMFAALAALPDSEPALADTAVARLVACLGRPEVAPATLDGQTISVGVLCYKALSVFAYHEEAGPDGGLTTKWAGFLPPDPSAGQLQAAQRAWRTAVREKNYHFL